MRVCVCVCLSECMPEYYLLSPRPRPQHLSIIPVLLAACTGLHVIFTAFPHRRQLWNQNRTQKIHTRIPYARTQTHRHTHTHIDTHTHRTHTHSTLEVISIPQ